MMDRIHRFFGHGCVGFVFIGFFALPVGAGGGGLVGLWLFEGSRMEPLGFVGGMFGGMLLLTWAHMWLAGAR